MERPAATNGIPIPEGIRIAAIPIRIVLAVIGITAVVLRILLQAGIELLHRISHKCTHLFRFLRALLMAEVSGLFLEHLAIFDEIFFAYQPAVLRNDSSVRKTDTVDFAGLIIPPQVIGSILKLQIGRVIRSFTEWGHQLINLALSRTFQSAGLALKSFQKKPQSKTLRVLRQLFFDFCDLFRITHIFLAVFLQLGHIKIDQCYKMTHFFDSFPVVRLTGSRKRIRCPSL